MNKRLKFIVGLVIGALALLDIAVNVLPMTNDVGASMVPSIRMPVVSFQPHGPNGFCDAMLVAAHGFPFDTEHYGQCGDEHSPVVALIDWAMAALLVVIAAVLVVGGALSARWR